jgi:hypothetical protein
MVEITTVQWPNKHPDKPWDESRVSMATVIAVRLPGKRTNNTWMYQRPMTDGLQRSLILCPMNVSPRLFRDLYF